MKPSHWNAWNSSPMLPESQNLQMRSSGGNMRMAPQFDVQAMVGTSEAECLGPKIRGAFVEVRAV